MIAKFIKYKMVKIIIFGELSKKHILPLSLAIYQVLNKIFNTFYPQKASNSNIEMYAIALGMLSIIFLPCIFKLKVIEEDKEKVIHKKKWLHYPLLIIIYWIYNITKMLMIAKKVEAKGNDQTMNPLAESPFAFIGLEMILLTIASIILLKYKYFIHHIISMVGFILFGNFSDLLLGTYTELIKFGAVPIFIQIFGVISDVAYYYYQKYMMEKLFYPYWRISFAVGIGLVLFTTVLLIYILVLKEKANPFIVNYQRFYSYFNGNDIGLKVLKMILNYISSVISTILYILNIYYFSPNFILISFQFNKFVDVLINEKDTKKYFTIIFFVVQIFFLMIYLEIIELNFCDLNKNTKKNIDLRSIIEESGQNGRDSSVGLGVVDINADYTLNLSENGNKNDNDIELLQQNENEEMQGSIKLF